MFHRALPLALLLALTTSVAVAQETRYVSDKIYIVLHSGPGTNYKWLAKLTPGRQLTTHGQSQDGKWTEVATERGTRGWVQSEHISPQPPAQVQLPEAQRRAAQLTASNTEFKSELELIKAEKVELLNQITATESKLRTVTEDFTQLKQVSGKAVQLDSDNSRLVAESEDLRASMEMLEAENQRLTEKLKSEDFFNGALAVLLGVIIALVVPLLRRPKRNKSSSWA
jgi:SH3 domain protein